MNDRGEDAFVSFPGPAAFFYDRLIQGKSTKQQVDDIDSYLMSQIYNGKLLDVGT
jgi:hypothetical protein